MRFGAFALLLLLSSAAAEAQIRGGVRVLDGDSVWIQGIAIELDGIDAPEADQRCLKADGRHYACGELATRALRTIIGGQRATCEQVGRTATGKPRARCRLRRRDLAREMLALGWAVAPEGAPGDYAKAQAEAEAKREGIWDGRFVLPWEWRRGKRLVETTPAPPPPSTVVRAPAPDPAVARPADARRPPPREAPRPAPRAAEPPPSAAPPSENKTPPPEETARAAPGPPKSAPVPEKPARASAPAAALAPSSTGGRITGPHPRDCPIKGNIDTTGRRLYYLPTSKWYNIILVDQDAGERWFCNEKDALAAGWRKFP